MPSPKSKKRSSSTSLARLSAGAAVRRGDIKISDPFPVDQGYDGHPPSTTVDINAMSSTSWQQDATWPRKSTPPEMHHVRNASYGHERNESSRVSAGPSLIPSSISREASKGSLTAKKSTGGFRSALKRMFGSKRGRQSMFETRRDYHRSVSGFPNLPDHRFEMIITLAVFSGSRKFDVYRGEADRPLGGTNSNPGRWKRYTRGCAGVALSG